LEHNPVGKIRSCINYLPAEVIARFSAVETVSGDERIFQQEEASEVFLENNQNLLGV
jgi:hypothetical protein